MFSLIIIIIIIRAKINININNNNTDIGDITVNCNSSRCDIAMQFLFRLYVFNYFCPSTLHYFISECAMRPSWAAE